MTHTNSRGRSWPMPEGLGPDEFRSVLMGRVRQKGTKPELVVRSLAHALGYRFRLHRKNLPGTPDLVFPSKRKTIFVHGCFWHGHPGCKHATVPKARRNYWIEKFAANRERDGRTEMALRDAGWDVLVIWECETRAPQALVLRLLAFLGQSGRANVLPSTNQCVMGQQ